ncbi:putative receptor-like protein kinase [Hordeum vulgare]|nr:putative receptor-like protein kinase [Hordeum vulgare]
MRASQRQGCEVPDGDRGAVRHPSPAPGVAHRVLHEQAEMILVYEYMRKARYGATCYAENQSHRDVKSTNILLGSDGGSTGGVITKVADFGLFAHLGPSFGETHVSTAVEGQLRGRAARKMADPRIAGEVDEESLLKFVETAEKCLADCWVDRPSMGDVL